MITYFDKINFMALKKHIYLFILVFISQYSFAQVTTYSFGEAASTYTALTTPTPSIAYSAPWDDHVLGSAFLAPIGFTFNYDGINQTQCYISPNGFLSFGVQPTPTTYLPLSVATTFTNGGTISALGMDLISASSSASDDIVYSTIGSAPNRIFVVQWSNVRRKAVIGNFNFQIRLSETSNSIEFSYGVCSPTDVTVYNAQVGIRGVTNDFLQGDVNNRLQNGGNVNTTWFGKTVSGVASSSTVRTSSTEYPNDGLQYTYTPSVSCITPTGVPLNLVIGNTSVSSTSFVGNSFTAATPAPTNYLIVRSTVNTPPTNITIPNRDYWYVNDVIASTYTVISNTNSVSFTQTGLTPNTTYYYWVIPYNEGCLGGPFYNVSSMITGTKTTCIAAPGGISTAAIGGNSFTASWNTVTGAANYTIDVSTNNTFTAILPAYSDFPTGGANSIVLTGLNPLTLYYFRVRAIGIACNEYSATGSATTICGAFPIPYSQNFDTTVINTTPTCFTITDNNSDTVKWNVQNSFAASTPNAFHLATNTVTTPNDWFFTPGLNLIPGVSYRLKFKYNTQSAGLYTENLRVRLGTGASVTDMNITILDLPNIVNTVYQTAIVDFTPVTNNIFYIGFQGYSFANQSKIMIDDISIIVSPTCFEPNSLTINTITSTTVNISWEAASPEPLNGYQYYVSTTSTTPSDLVTPSGSVAFGVVNANITGLSPATLYYVWVRGNCGGTDRSVWSLVETFSTDCSTAALLAVTNGTLCGGGSTTLQATSSPGSTIEWFSDLVSQTVLGTGNNFVTPTLASTTTFYAQSRAPGGLITVGPLTPLLQGGALGIQLTPTVINFSVSTNTNFQSFDIFPMVSGQSGIVTIRNASNAVLATYPYTTSVAGGNTPQIIPMSFNLASGNYSLSFDTLPAGGLLVNIDSASYPYASTIATIIGNGFDNTFYMYAYNWKFSNICRSIRTPVVATVTAAPPISFSSSTATVCYGEIAGSVTVTGSAAYNTFNWNTTVGLVGTVSTGFTFQPLTTTTYSLTASQSSGSLCSSVISFSVNVKPQPPSISVIPATATICQGQILPLNASLAVSPPVTVYEEAFNAPSNNWSTINASYGGTVANSAWTLRNSVYSYTSSFWNINVSSNDASQFYFSNSDAQGGPTSNRTLTSLISPSINLSGLTSATISFWHYLRYVGGNIAQLQVSIDGGTTWALLAPGSTFTANQGSASTFKNSTFDISSLVGNSNVKFKFFYDATWDWGWAIDNVKITGVLALEVSWLPTTDLYFDAAATNPYIAGTPTAIVYTKPNSNITYTGSVLGANGCSASNTSVITVTPTAIAGLLSGSQSICNNSTPTPLTLTGYSGGVIIRWDYATDAAFTLGVTPIATTASTLSAALIGTYTGDRYFRVVLKTGTCPEVYSNVVLVSFPSTTWTVPLGWSNGAPNSTTRAVFNGDYTSSGNLDACGVEVISGAVVFNSGHTLNVQNEVKITSGSLTFENNASLVQVNTLNSLGLPISNTGSITYKRNSTPVKKFDYTYWSSPVNSQTLFNFSPNSSKFYEYNPVIGNWQDAVINNPMVLGKGYIVRTPDIAPFNTITSNYFYGSFIGVPNTGTITIPVTLGVSQSNLLGNPYPSAFSANAFLSDPLNVPVIDGTIRLWTHNTPIASGLYTSNDYATYNYTGGVGTSATNVGGNNSVPNGKIASGQGFFVKALTPGNVVFNNSMRLVGNNDQFFRISDTHNLPTTQELERHRFWLDISNTEGAFKQLLIAYIENATNGWDRGYDGEMTEVGNAVTLYIMQEDKKLCIQGRALPFNENDAIPIGYKSTIASTFQIKLSNFDGLFDTQAVYLEDTVLNIIHNLRTSDYSFATEAGTFNNRFIVRFIDTTLDVEIPTFDANQVVIYKNQSNDFVINTGTNTMASVKVYDIRGRLLIEKKDINATQTTIGGGMANEVLLIQITTTEGIVVTKRAIR